ncbi:MAG: serpin family protein [Candidatus Eisenbacteria bacterium]|nr:serpin family protein [Candidatus Eisenbacteria bacterium]
MNTPDRRKSFRFPILAALILLLAPFLAGCDDSGGGPSGGDASWSTLHSGLDRNLAPDATTEELRSLVEGNHGFTLALLQSFDAGGNLLFSPYSIRSAFAMTWAGARGETETEMTSALLYDPDQERTHNAFNEIGLILDGRALPASGGEDPVELHVANAFWGQTGYDYLEDYLDVLAVNYGAGVELLDLNGAKESARDVINDWVSDHTASRIEELIPEGFGTDLPLVAVLTNALYFKAPWAKPFEDDLTADGVFHLEGGGGDVVAPMMRREETFGWYADDRCRAVELAYRGGGLSMVLILPEEGTLDAFVSSLDGDRLGEILDGIDSAFVSVTLPRFSFESSFELKETLIGLGMSDPFAPGADFSGMMAGRDIWIDEAYHKTFIAVDEKGTEAAAATAVVLVERGGAENVFTADHPFLFLIRDRETGLILFCGRVIDPAA